MRILALDLSSQTGWATSAGDAGVQSFPLRRGDSPGMRWLEVRAWLNRLLDAFPAELIGYEQAHHRGGAATHLAHSMISVVEAVAAEREIELTNRHTATIKKHATGKGSAGKEQMLSLAREKWGEAVVDDNEADARWLLDLLLAEYGSSPDGPLPAAPPPPDAPPRRLARRLSPD